MVARTLTVVFTDIKGFTARTSASSRAEMVHILKKHEELLKPFVISHGGTVVKTIGDAFLLTFESPTNAVLCGLRMQAALKQYNADAPEEEKIEIRIAINTGEVELIGNDIFGESVNIASRVEGVTKEGEIYFTEATYLVMNKSEVPSSEVGEFRFKGIPESIKLYRVLQDENLELYNQVVQSQSVYDQVTPDEGAVPEGAFSSSLLYTLEQQQALAGGGRMAPVIWAVAMAVLVVLIGLGYWGLTAYRYQANRAQAEQFLATGKVQEALDLLSALRIEKATDPQLLDLAGRAVEADLARLRSAQRFEEARRKLEFYRKTYPNLPNLDAIVRRTRLAEAELLYKRDQRQAHKKMIALAKEFPQDPEVKFRLAYHSVETMGGREVARGFRLYRELVEEDPEQYKNNEWVLKGIKAYLAGFNLLGKEKEQAFIRQGYYDALKPYLQEHLTEPGERGANLRRNAFILLKNAGDLTPEEEFRFYTAELFWRHTDAYKGPFMEDTFRYWEGLVQKGFTEELKRYLPEQLPEARILKNFHTQSQRALKVIETFFADALKQFLLESLGNIKETGYRVHAYRIAKQKGWLNRKLTAAYHLANLSDYEPEVGYGPNWAPPDWIEESLGYYSSARNRQNAKKAVRQLARLDTESAKSASVYAKREQDKQAKAFQTFNKRVKKALRVQKGV